MVIPLRLMRRRHLAVASIFIFPLILHGQELTIDPPRIESFHFGQNGRPEQAVMRFSEDADPTTVQVEVLDDYVILDGDIIIGKAGEVFNGRAGVIDLAAREWPNSTIPYTITAGFPDVNKLYLAINHIINNTNICMAPRTTEANYVEFVASEGCSSSVGMVGGRQEIRIAGGCTVGSTIHEILHAAGHWHEQSRKDRDKYVSINLNNIQEGRASDFETYLNGTDLGPYDYGSIMHYPPYTYSVNGQATIEVRMPPGNPSVNIGQRVGLSSLDVSAVNQVYTSAPSCNPVQVAANLTCKSLGILTVNGSHISITGAVVANDGQEPIGASQAYYYYLSEGNMAHGFGAVMIPALAPGEQYSLDLSADLSMVEDGTYRLGIWLNPYKEVTEVNYGDNFCTWYAPQLVLPAQERDCPEVVTVSEDQASGYYQAAGTLQTSGEVMVSGSASFVAGSEVRITEGFHAMPGSNFQARIESCGNPSAGGTEVSTTEISKPDVVTQDVSWRGQRLKIAPNPFSGETTITFSLTAPDKLDIAVFDVNGRQVHQPAAGRQFEAGEHRMVYDGRQLSAGVYVLVVQGEGYFASARMVVGW